MSAPSSVRFERVSKAFGGVVAVKEVSFEIEAGNLVTLLGPSGCGKTTTLRMIAGLELPSSGRIFIGAQEVTSLPATARDVAMVFQSYALFPHMTVIENVAYGLTVSGVRRAEAHGRAEQALALVGLAGFGARLPSELSGGQQQRVAVARAVVLEPQVLLFDEPLSNLDAKLRRHVREEIRDLQRQLGITAVYVTHDQAEALAISDRVIVMSNAAIAQEGSPRELYEEPADRFVADFIGDANIVEVEIVAVDGDDADVRLGTATIRLARRGLAPGPALLAIRPAALLLSASPADGVLEGEVLKASYLGSHVEYEVGTPVGELFVIDGHASRMLAACDARRHPLRRSRRDADPGPLTRPTGSAEQRDAGQGRDLVRDAGCRGQDRVAPPQPVAGQEVVDATARLLDQEDPGQAIPGIDVLLEIGVGPPVGDVGQAQGTRAEAPEIDAGLEHPLDHREIGGVGHARRPADLDAGALDPVGARPHGSAFRSSVAPCPRRARNNSSVTGLKMAPSCTVPPATNATETQKRAHAADEVRRAVDRVDHPHLVADLAALFLAEEVILGKGFGQAARQQALDRRIGFAGIVLRALEGDLQRVPAIEPVQRQLAGLDRHGPENLLAPVKLGLFGSLWHSAPFRDVRHP